MITKTSSIGASSGVVCSGLGGGPLDYYPPLTHFSLPELALLPLLKKAVVGFNVKIKKILILLLK